jgi:hypothetical protein
MPLLNGKTVFFIERHLFSQAACANGVGTVIEQHRGCRFVSGRVGN